MYMRNQPFVHRVVFITSRWGSSGGQRFAIKCRASLHNPSTARNCNRASHSHSHCPRHSLHFQLSQRPPPFSQPRQRLRSHNLSLSSPGRKQGHRFVAPSRSCLVCSLHSLHSRSPHSRVVHPSRCQTHKRAVLWMTIAGLLTISTDTLRTLRQRTQTRTTTRLHSSMNSWKAKGTAEPLPPAPAK